MQFPYETLVFAFIVPPAVGMSNPYTAMLTAAAEFGTKFLSSLGKSPEQKEAEYALSEQTNQIEKAMDINRFAFRCGFLTQNQALQNYDYLWGSLKDLADRVRSITPAQAERTITDRDYGGKFASTWRGIMRDDSLLGNNEPGFADYALDSNGYVLPQYRWDATPEVLKYGLSPSNIKVPNAVPTPQELPQGPGATPARLLSSTGGKIALAGAIGYLVYKIVD